VNNSYQKAVALYNNTCASVGSESHCGLLNIPRAYWTSEVFDSEEIVEKNLRMAIKLDDTTGIPANGARLFYAELMHAQSYDWLAAEQVAIILKNAPAWEAARKLLQDVVKPPYSETPHEAPASDGWIYYADGTAWRVTWDMGAQEARCEFMNKDKFISVVACHH